MCFPVRSIKCLDYRFSVWLFLQLCGRAWCVFPGAGLGESSSMLRQKQVVFMGMSNRNMALELLSTLSLIPVTEQWSPRCVKGMPPTSNCTGLCFRTWWLYPAMLSCQSGKNESVLFPLLSGGGWNQCKSIWNLVLVKLLLKSTVIAQARNLTFGGWILKTCCF